MRDVPELVDVIRTKHLAIAYNTVVVRFAEAREIDPEAIRLIRLELERDEYALEQAENELAQRLAEAMASR